MKMMEVSNVATSMEEEHTQANSSPNLVNDSVPSSPLADDGSNSSGRWTQDEHELFLNGLKLYNRQWKQIADIIKTRTVVQIRTHAQKYFQKLSKCNKINNSALGIADEADFSLVVKMKTLPNTPTPRSPKEIKEKSTPTKQYFKNNRTTNSLAQVACTGSGNVTTETNTSTSSNVKFSNDLCDFEWLATSSFPPVNDERQENSMQIRSPNCIENSKKVQNDAMCNDDYIDFSWLVENDLAPHSNEYSENIAYNTGIFDLSSNDSSSGTSEESLSNHDGDEEMSHPFDNEFLFANPSLPAADEGYGIFTEKKRSYSCTTYENISLQKKRGRPLKLRRQLTDNILNDFCHGQVLKEMHIPYIDACEDEFNIFGLIDL